MIYNIFKTLLRVALRIFFRKLQTNNMDHIPQDKATIFVANHQSAFMDALLIGTLLPQPLQFISRGESFNTPIKRWFYGLFNMTPVYRKFANPELMHKNEGLLETYQQLLLDNKSVMIFPEGISKIERRLYKIKTGAARIILGAAEAADYQQEIVVIPVGLNYTNPHQFRSDVLINFGEPIPLAEYFEQHQENAWEAVTELTARIKQEIKDLCFTIEDKKLDHLYDAIETLYEEELVTEATMPEQGLPRVFKIKREVANAIHFFNQHEPKRVKQAKDRFQHFYDLMQKFQIQKTWLKTNASTISTWALIKLVIGVPIYWYALINNALVITINKTLTDRVVYRPDFYGSILFIAGFFLFPLFYGLQIMAVGLLTHSFIWTIIYANSLLTSSYFALRYQERLKIYRTQKSIQNLAAERNDMLNYLKRQRMLLLEMCREARGEYLAAG